MTDLIEKLAQLEYERWANWTVYMLDNLTWDNIARWRRQAETPYHKLSEREKEDSRGRAQKVFEMMLKHFEGGNDGQQT